MKKIVGIILSVLLIVGTMGSLTACGGDDETVTSLKVFGIASGVTDAVLNGHEVATMVEGHTGYDVTFYQASADATTAQSEIMTIFSQKLDYQTVMVTKSQFYTLLAQGGLKDITSYVGETTNMKNVIGESGWGMASNGGKIYGVPQKDAKVANNVGIAFRLDFLNSYNTANPNALIPVPSEDNGWTMTTADYKTYLAWVKANKTGTGGEITSAPMRVDFGNPIIEPIMSAFGIYQEWADENSDKKLEYISDQAGFDDYLNYMNELAVAGLAVNAKDSADTGAAAALKKSTEGNYVAASAKVAHWNPAAYENSVEEAAKYSYISALIPAKTYADNAARKASARYWANEGYGYFTVVPKHASDAQAKAAVDYMDKKLDAEFFKKLVIGEEGTHHKIEKGEYYPILPKFDERNIADKFINGTREDDYAKYWLCRTRKTAAQDKMFSRANYNIANCGIKNPIVVMPPNQTYDTQFGARNTKVREQMILSMFPASGQDRVSPSSITTLFKSGTIDGSTKSGTEITTSVNDWYTTWVGGNGKTYNTVGPRV